MCFVGKINGEDVAPKTANGPPSGLDICASIFYYSFGAAFTKHKTMRTKLATKRKETRIKVKWKALSNGQQGQQRHVRSGYQQEEKGNYWIANIC